VLTSLTDFDHAAGPTGTGQAGVEFLLAHGYELALGDVQRTVELPIPEEILDRIAVEAGPRHEGYHLRQFENRCPDDLVASYGRLIGRLVTEAPVGEKVIEDQVFDEERIRQDEAVREAAGRASVVTVAVDPAGDVVAYTEIAVSGHHSGRAYQWGTLVDPAHRGHRLGVAVKSANHRLLQHRHPEVHEVVTNNAEVNGHMIAVNELLGFRPTGRSAEFQKTVS
jgi:RimJ/RimL family protein N-acetyltransferase